MNLTRLWDLVTLKGAYHHFQLGDHFKKAFENKAHEKLFIKNNKNLYFFIQIRYLIY